MPLLYSSEAGVVPGSGGLMDHQPTRTLQKTLSTPLQPAHRGGGRAICASPSAELGRKSM